MREADRRRTPGRQTSCSQWICFRFQLFAAPLRNMGRPDAWNFPVRPARNRVMFEVATVREDFATTEPRAQSYATSCLGIARNSQSPNLHDPVHLYIDESADCALLAGVVYQVGLMVRSSQRSKLRQFNLEIGD